MTVERRRLVSIVVPVYDSPSLEALTVAIDAVFRDAADDYEIVFVDDASPNERGWRALERLARRALPALMFHVSKDVVGVPVRHAPRAGGRSGYTPRKLLRLFSNLVINNSSLLLRGVAAAGVLFAFSSFVLAAIVIYRKLADKVAVQGWTSLMAAVLLTGGLLLVSVGIMGEYLIRIIQSAEARPPYFVRRRAAASEADDRVDDTLSVLSAQ